MPRVQVTETTLYQYSELSDAAKEKARDWWREMESNDPAPWDYMYDDFIRCAEIIGITIDNRTQKWINVSNGESGARREPCIYWSGFSSQGDGACFEGSYSYAKGSRHAIRKHAPVDTQLHHIADELQSLQSKYFYTLGATVKQRGNYSHEYATSIDIDAPDWIKAEDYKEVEDKLSDLLRDFMRWMYSQLQKEYDYRMSDEQVAENIEANEYEFTEDGEIV